MRRVKGGITAPLGFKAGAIKAGIKQSGRPDLAIVYSEVPAAVAGVFTKNQVKAAPIIVSQQLIKSGKCQAIIANAGNANARTGERGIGDALTMVHETALALGVNPKHILVTSTGSIGHYLPMEKIVPAIRKLAGRLTDRGGEAVARAILTTDTKKKEIALKVGKYTIAGVAKGSGMIHPDMATMHAFITTDAAIDRALLQTMLKQATKKSFNLISVDQCQSTNDCVFVLANGLSGEKIDNSSTLLGTSRKSKTGFYKALETVCVYLAKEIARDGEGATQLITVKVSGAYNEREAAVVARAIACSDLLKCAVYGQDKNLGRIFAAVGSTPARIDLGKLTADMKFGRGEAVVTCDLGVGKARATAWGCDLTEGYIKINAEYHT